MTSRDDSCCASDANFRCHDGGGGGCDSGGVALVAVADVDPVVAAAAVVVDIADSDVDVVVADTRRSRRRSNFFVGAVDVAGPTRRGRWSTSRRRSSAAEGTTCPAGTSSTGSRS